jgi:hypothetical protein
MESESTADKYSHVFRFVNWRNENNPDFVRVQQIFCLYIVRNSCYPCYIIYPDLFIYNHI